jgi:transposase InsO family protein
MKMMREYDLVRSLFYVEDWSRHEISRFTGIHRKTIAKMLLYSSPPGYRLRKPRPQPGLVHHSDRGRQYAAGDYQNMLKDNKMACGMSRKGDCWDNAPMESFFATLKTELIYGEQLRTQEEAKNENI